MSMSESYYRELLENDPRYIRTLEEEVIKLKRDNERMRKSLRRIETVSGSDGWKDDIIKICNKAAKEGLK